VFASCFKVYSTMSARRFMSDLRDAEEKGYLRTVPHFNSILNYLDNPILTPILRALITESSLPLKNRGGGFRGGFVRLHHVSVYSVDRS
jgi:hypothetical protein